MGRWINRFADMPTPEDTYYAERGKSRAKKWAATSTGATEARAETARHTEAAAKVSRWKGGRG